MFYERHLKSWVINKTVNLPNKRSPLLQSIPPSDSEGGRASERASPMAKVREIPAASDGDNNGSERNETVSNPTHGGAGTVSSSFFHKIKISIKGEGFNTSSDAVEFSRTSAHS